MKDFDLVVLTEDLPKKKFWCDEQVPDEGLKEGAEGTIIDTLVRPSLAYQVEFVDDQGSVVGIAIVELHQVALLKSIQCAHSSSKCNSRLKNKIGQV